VYAAVQQAAAEPGSDSWDLGKFMQYTCLELTEQNEPLRQQRTAHAAEAVLSSVTEQRSIAGQLAVVPVRSDCMRYELRHQTTNHPQQVVRDPGEFFEVHCPLNGHSADQPNS